MEAGLRELLSPKPVQHERNSWARAQIEKEFDIRTVASKVEAVYKRAIASARDEAPRP